MSLRKNELPYMSTLVEAELAAAEDMSNEQLGALYRLKLKLWRAGGFLPEDKLISASRAGKRWGAMASELLEHLTIAGGKVSSGDVLIAMEAARKRRSKQAEKGEKAANARWQLERVRRSGKPISEVATAQISDALLSATNSLSELSPSMLGASPEQCLSMPNQNQKNIDSKNLSAGVDAAGPSENIQRRGVQSSPQQYSLLYDHGAELLRARCGHRKLSGHAQIAKWLLQVGDAERLIILLGTAERDDLKGDDFFNFVDEQACDDERERTGAALAAESYPPSGGQPAQQSTDDTSPELWLETEGRRIAVERSRDYPGAVATRLARWLREVGQNHAALGCIVRSADSRAKSAAHFTALIGDGIRQYREGLSGPQLPLKGVIQGDLQGDLIDRPQGGGKLAETNPVDNQVAVAGDRPPQLKAG